ncbi:hypothetical protein RF679_06880 [Undibacterium cyanobacteriorum]|uniref:Uncharacterized protein n=1 Tax=Undibacterium cyanobacteriorum TaxID=3073561 RepID=A0ABY9RLD7_9BURK|nr:hypothetical protein [Undibacterium sp. 20NA77.5]WMW82004.1 hypothetical protein RF679_06880 [Undibacterium sp. 20NA77.5]
MKLMEQKQIVQKQIQHNYMSQLIGAALLALSMGTASASVGAMGDPDDPQTDKKMEVRTQVMVMNNGQTTTRTETSVFPEKASFFTTSNGGMHFFSSAEPVKNAPYSAEAISETVQKLADGNTISSKSSMLNFRDSAGRSRTEVRNAKGETTQIMISDPAGSVLTLNPATKTATKLETKVNFVGGKLPAGGIREINVEKIRKGKEGGENVEVRAIVGDAKPGEKTVVVRRVEGGELSSTSATTSATNHMQGKEITIDVRGPEHGSAIGMLANGPDGAFMRLFADSKWAAKKQSKTLGTKEIEGVKAEGKLTSYEIPAGEIGNAQALVVSDEVWTSPELQLVVYSKHSDPRSGDRIYRLTNLKREEVAASQFVAPSDYKVRDLAKEMKVIMKDGLEKTEKVEKIERK